MDERQGEETGGASLRPLPGIPGCVVVGGGGFHEPGVVPSVFVFRAGRKAKVGRLCRDSGVPSPGLSPLCGGNVLALAQPVTAQIPLRWVIFMEISCCSRRRPITH